MLSRHSGHATAFFSASITRIGAPLAVIHAVLSALVAA
jgi:hypothetical protein